MNHKPRGDNPEKQTSPPVGAVGPVNQINDTPTLSQALDASSLIIEIRQWTELNIGDLWGKVKFSMHPPGMIFDDVAVLADDYGLYLRYPSIPRMQSGKPILRPSGTPWTVQVIDFDQGDKGALDQRVIEELDNYLEEVRRRKNGGRR